MSSRWQAFKTAMRPHMHKPLCGTNVGIHEQYHNVMSLLRVMLQFQTETPLRRGDALPAHLEITLMSGPDATRETPTATRRVATHLWSAVLPWESAKGLSGSNLMELLPPPALRNQLLRKEAPPTTHDDDISFRDIAAATSPDDSEVGMMFVAPLEAARSNQPASFWSGAISAPIDVAFLKRVDKVPDLRARLASASLPSKARAASAPTISSHFDDESLQGHGLELVLVDQGKLEPFTAHDKVFGTPFAQWYSDLYPPTAMAPPPDIKRATEITSRSPRIAVIVELRRRYFYDHITDVMRGGCSDTSKNQTDVHIVMQLSNALHDEIKEKKQLHRTMVQDLERGILQLLQFSREGKLAGNPPSASEEDSERNGDQPTEEENGGWSRSVKSQRDSGAQLPANSVPVSMKGRSFVQQRLTAEQAQEMKRRTSASARLKYPNSDPRMAVQPKLPYELIALAYRMNLCIYEIGSLCARMIKELDEGLVDPEDLVHLEALLDPSLIVAEELRGAIRAEKLRQGAAFGRSAVPCEG